MVKQAKKICLAKEVLLYVNKIKIRLEGSKIIQLTLMITTI